MSLIKVTNEEAAQIIRDFTFGKTPVSKEAKIQRPIVPGSVGHYLFRKEGEELVRHGVIGQIRPPSTTSTIAPWWVAYLSLRFKAEIMYPTPRLDILGRPISFVGPGGSIHILPRRLKQIEESILPLDRVYIGADWYDNVQPTQDEVECGLAGLVQVLDAAE